jgi:hypothetical protein
MGEGTVKTEFSDRERQLLWVLGDKDRGVQPGGFYEALFKAALLADGQNLTLIGLGFASVAFAVIDWRASSDGWNIRT